MPPNQQNCRGAVERSVGFGRVGRKCAGESSWLKREADLLAGRGASLRDVSRKQIRWAKAKAALSYGRWGGRPPCRQFRTARRDLWGETPGSRRSYLDARATFN